MHWLDTVVPQLRNPITHKYNGWPKCATICVLIVLKKASYRYNKYFWDSPLEGSYTAVQHVVCLTRKLTLRNDVPLKSMNNPMALVCNKYLGIRMILSAPMADRPNVDLAYRPNELRNIWGAGIYLLFSSFFLSGLHWHVCGFSERPTEQRLVLLHAGEPFPFRSLFFRIAFSPSVCFCGPFFRVFEHVVAEHLPQTKHSKPQLAFHKAAKQVRADQSATTQASRQS